MRWLMVGVLCLCSCRRQETFDIAGAKHRAVLTLPLAHDASSTTTTSPVLHVTINGVPVRLIVDTGATTDAITKWLAVDLKIPMTTHADDAARDYVGAPLEVARSAPIVARAGGTVVIRGAVPVVESPVLDQARGIGGVLAPRLLLPPGHSVVLDLVHNKLGVVATELADRLPHGPAKSLAPMGMRSCSVTGIYLVSAKIDDRDVTLRLDTGAEQTTMFVTSPVGKLLSAKSNGGTASVAEVDVRAGDVARKVSVRLVPAQVSPGCQYDGLLGMDVLKKCQIELDAKHAFAECED